MGNPAHYVIEAEFFTKGGGPMYQSIQEQVSRWLMAPEPLACIRFFDEEEVVAKAMTECLEAERKRDAIRARLQRQESVGVADRPHGRLSVKQLAKTLAASGDAACKARREVTRALDETFRKVARNHCDIVMRNHGFFAPLDRIGVLYVMQELEGITTSSLSAFRADSLFERATKTELLLL